MKNSVLAAYMVFVTAMGLAGIVAILLVPLAVHALQADEPVALLVGMGMGLVCVVIAALATLVFMEPDR